MADQKVGFDDFIAAGGSLDDLILNLTPAGDPSTNDNAIEARLMGLAQMTKLEYDSVRKEVAAELGVRLATLDEEVEKRRPHNVDENTDAPAEPPVHGEEVDGVELFNKLSAAFERHMVFPCKEAVVAIALWVIFTYVIPAVQVAPRLAVTSPTKRCGKSRLLSILSYLVFKPVPASNTSTAVLYRAIESWHPTLLLDEADTFYNSPDKKDLVGIVNSGHQRRMAFVMRCEGDDHKPKRFSTFTPIALGLIGALKDTTADRSIEIRLQRRMKTEPIAKLRHKQGAALEQELVPLCARWAKDHAARIEQREPTEAKGLEDNDRACDSWEPLLQVADEIGGDVPQMARKAASVLSGAANQDKETLAVLALGDIQSIFAASQVDKMASETICGALQALEERPWRAYGKNARPISQNNLAWLLGSFQTPGGARIESRTIRVPGLNSGSEKTAKGYVLEDLKEAFLRYLPPTQGKQSVTPSQPNGEKGETHFSETSQDPFERACDVSKNGSSLYGEKGCDGVTFQKRRAGGKKKEKPAAAGEQGSDLSKQEAPAAPDSASVQDLDAIRSNTTANDQNLVGLSPEALDEAQRLMEQGKKVF